jgi:hypothetical protein
LRKFYPIKIYFIHTFMLLGFLQGSSVLLYSNPVKNENTKEKLQEASRQTGFPIGNPVTIIHTKTGIVFPGSRHVKPEADPTETKFTCSHLTKNDLNGLFLTDQPGQPFNGDPGNTAGSDLPPP